MIKNKDNDYINQDKHVAKSSLFCTDKFPLLCKTSKWNARIKLTCPWNIITTKGIITALLYDSSL